MSAREMFEKLDFKYELKDDFCIRYVYKGIREKVVTFYLRDKDFSCSLYHDDKTDGGGMIDIELFKAIQQQILELGWEE